MDAERLAPGAYSSSNLRKHTSQNPLQRLLLERFHEVAGRLLAMATPSPRRILDAGCGEGFAMRAVLGPAAVHTLTASLKGVMEL